MKKRNRTVKPPASCLYNLELSRKQASYLLLDSLNPAKDSDIWLLLPSPRALTFYCPSFLITVSTFKKNLITFLYLAMDLHVFWENSIETSIITRVKQISSPGWMHETCSGLVHWEDPEGWDGEGGGRGIRMGNTCIHFSWLETILCDFIFRK